MDNTAVTEDILIAMASAGVSYGHKKSKTHPQMMKYIADIRNEITFLNPQNTLESLENACEFLKSVAKEEKIILFVGTTVPAQESIKTWAESRKAPYVVTRWLGGLLTNFEVLHKRLLYYENLKDRQTRGELSKYTKKEQGSFKKELEKLSFVFDGLKNLNRIPDVLFAVDPKKHATAVREAQKLKIPIVAVLDTDDDPSHITYPIFANDHSKMSIEWVVTKCRETMEK